ncbi:MULTISPECIES: thioredoxin domain-containing protein [unclassified Actinomyces]|uniref:DsbA family protein n=1 Tax=unclassified Actinomyces TaxID=2609248 RepID=UPI001373981F|nr:thioredoxin domain-containing protein [Actinomyces sp. 432]NDR53390.1 thioredoxin domain-containing protein [Actinomyces sp. 565]QHO91963.1 disulfide bond formation protein DsbA [Actinomyces sp. 432]
MASNQPRPTKAERREAARAKARALREEQERRERRARITRRSFLGVGGLAVAGTVAAVVIAGRDEEALGGKIVTDLASGDGIPATIRADGSLVFGSDLQPGTSTDGAQNLHIYFDYSCHHCANFEELHKTEIETLLGDGTINLVLHTSRSLGNSWSDMVCNAMGVVLDQEPTSAFAFHHAVMTRFSEIYARGDFSAINAESVTQAATEAGVGDAVVEQIASAITANTYGAWLDLCDKTFAEAAITGTPTVALGSEKLELTDIATETGITDRIRGGSGSSAQ